MAARTQKARAERLTRHILADLDQLSRLKVTSVQGDQILKAINTGMGRLIDSIQDQKPVEFHLKEER